MIKPFPFARLPAGHRPLGHRLFGRKYAEYPLYAGWLAEFLEESDVAIRRKATAPTVWKWQSFSHKRREFFWSTIGEE